MIVKKTNNFFMCKKNFFRQRKSPKMKCINPVKVQLDELETAARQMKSIWK